MREIRISVSPELHKKVRLLCAELDVSTVRLFELALDALDMERVSSQETVRVSRAKRGAA